jgi:hypothetical protein
VSFTLAASAEMLYLDLPLLDRVKRITERGLQVEIWDWSTKDIDALAASGATFSSMTGYLRGDLTTPDGIAELCWPRRRSPSRWPSGSTAPRLNLHGTGPRRERACRCARSRSWTPRDVADGGRHPAPRRRARRARPTGCSRWRT